MAPPVVIVAFGTSSLARSTYADLAQKVSAQLPDRQLFWASSSRILADRAGQENDFVMAPPTQVLEELISQGHRQVIVQSLHLLAGTEFHRLHQQVRSLPIAVAMGMPLLYSPADYQEIIAMLDPLITAQPDSAIVVVGHGTLHPVWPAYLALENLLQVKYGGRVLVGVVEKYPPCDQLISRIVAGGYHRVLLIPFLLVAGMHYRRDIIGKAADSWQSRLQEAGLEVSAHDAGLAVLPGIEGLIARHIGDADCAFGS